MKRWFSKFVPICLALISHAAVAQICTSTGATWNTNTNWTCTVPVAQRVPLATDAVVINSNMAVNTNTANVQSITINTGRTLTQNTNTMQTAGALIINGTGILNSGANLTVTGATTVNGTLNLTAGTKTFTSAVTNNGTWNNSGNLAVGFGSNLANNGTFTSGTNTQTFSVAGGPTLSGSQGITFSGVLTATNGLTINMGAAATTVTLNAASTVGASGLTITQGTLTSAANLTVSGATSIGTAATTSGTFNLTAGATHTHTGAVTVNALGTWNNSGNVAVSFGSNLVNNGTFTSGTNTQTFTVASPGPTLSGASAIAFSGAAAFTNGLTINMGAAATAVTLNGATTVGVGGGLTITQGTVNAAGNVTDSGLLAIAANGALSSSANLTVATTTAITGDFIITGGATHTHTGTVTVNAGGTWTNSGNTTVGFGANLVHNGTTFDSGTSTQTFSVASPGPTLSGSSAIAFSGPATFTNGLTVNMGAAATTFTLNGTTTIGAGGGLTVTRGTVSAAGNMTDSGLMSIGANGTLNSSANLTVTGTTGITGDFSITGGTTHTHTGTATINAGGTWTNSGNTAVTFGASLTNTNADTNGNAGNAFKSGTGDQNFTAATATLGGTAIVFDGDINASGNLAVANATVVTNNKAATIAGNLTGGNATSTWVNAANSQLLAGGTLLTTGVLNASASPNLVQYTANANQAIKLPLAVSGENRYYNLQLSGGNTKTPAAGTYTILGDLTIDTGVTINVNTNDPAITVGGSFLNNGTYTSSSSAVLSFLGGSAATFGGSSATTILNLTINKSAGIDVTIACGTPSPTVTGTLTLTQGNVVTSGTIGSGCATDCASQVPVIVTSAGTISGGSASSYVQGALQKGFAAAGALSYRAAGSDEFPIGTARISGANRYSPVEISAGTTTTAGSVTACATVGQNTNMSLANGGGIDTTKDVNRYWSLTTSAINTTASLMDATFKFVTTATSDVIGGANTASFIVERWDGVDWNPTTLNTAGATSTRVTGVNITTTTNDFVIGEPGANFPSALGLFNAFDTTAAANAVLGVIQTKQVGTGFSVRVVRLLNNSIDATFNTAGVQVQLVDASNNTGTFTNGCKPNWTTQIGTVNVNFASGVATATFPAAQIPNVYKDVRIRIGGGTGCSNDNFAIRPTSLTASAQDLDWQNAYAGVGSPRSLTTTTATGGAVHAASDPTATTPRPFTLVVAPQAAGGQSASNYAGSPTEVSAATVCCTPSTTPACGTLPSTCTAGTLTFTDTSWTGTGTRSNPTAHYTEAGVLNLQLEDQTFASVDASDGSSTVTRYVPATATASIGRFVPDRFVFVAHSTPVAPTLTTFGSTSCGSRSFTYIGQPFWYVDATTVPKAVLQALNAKGTVTTNYRGSLFKLANTDLAESYAEGTVGSPAVGCKLASNLATACTPANAPASLSAPSTDPSPSVGGNGAADYAAATNGPVLVYTRDASTAHIPYTANISLSLTATDSSEASVVKNPGNGATPTLTTSSAFVFNSIGFDQGAEFRYGRIRILNGAGPLTVNIPVTLRAEYYVSAAAGFTTNTADNCTSFTAQNFALTGHQSGAAGSITTTNMVSPTTGPVNDGNVIISGSLVAGELTTLKLAKPTGSVTIPGSVKICLDLDKATSVGACSAATPSDKSYLQGPWTSATNDADPTAQVNFGFFGAQPKSFIYLRENY